MFGTSIVKWKLSICAPQDQAPIHGTLERTSQFPGGNVWFQCFETSDGRVLRYPSLADFSFGSDTSSLEVVYARPLPGISTGTVNHLFHNSVVPMLVAEDGGLVLHGSAIDVGGAALVFLGDSGHGKSTLAASFATSGFPFLSDDSIRLSPESNGYVAHPSYPSVVT